MPAPSALVAATALRWSRPDLTGVLAEHLMESADAVSDRDGWLVAAGWRVHAAAAVGDGREAASEVLEALPRWGSDALSAAAGGRLRLELAVLGHDVGESGPVRALLDSVVAAGTDPELAADLATARLRCRDDGPLDPTDALAAWTAVGGGPAQVGSAAVLLITASADRRSDRPEEAVTHAVDGLGRLDRARTSPRALSPSPHLAAALAAEWISSLIGAGRSDQAGEGSRPLRERLLEHTRPTRQLALLRLTLTRVAAAEAGDGAADVARELERAAQEAAATDTPELEHICRTALAEVHEIAGRPEAARESARLAVVADRRHRVRAARFRTALVSQPGLAGPGAPTAAGERAEDRRLAEIRRIVDEAGGGRPAPDEERPVAGSPRTPAREPGSAERTAKLRAVQTASMAEHRPPDVSSDGAASGRRRRHTRNDTAPNSPGWGAVAWTAGPGAREESGDAPSNGAGSGADSRASHDRGPDDRGPDDRGTDDRTTHERGTNGYGADDRGANHRSTEGGAGNGRSRNDRGTNGHRAEGRDTHGRSTWGGVEDDRAARDRVVNGRGTSGRGSGGPRTGGGDAGGPVGGDRAPRDVAGPDGPDRGDGPGPDPWSTGVWSAVTGAAEGRSVDPPRGDRVADHLRTDGRGTGDCADQDQPGRRTSDRAESTSPAPEMPVNGSSGRATVASALADPEAWLASALADLDRIWGRRPDESTVGEAAAEDVVDPQDDGAAEEPGVNAAECVVVIDLVRGGVRLSADESAPTVRRVARRLPQRLPASGRLSRDTPDAVSVVLADGDRTAAAEWMRRVLPDLVEGLAVDAVVQGAQLRAAVHDEHGVVGAQVLQRLDGGRSRPSGGPAADPSRRATRRSETGPGLDTTGLDTTALDAASPAGRDSPEPAALETGGTVSGPRPGESPGRHDDSDGRRPYLPDGVVVRPGSGGRRHRRSEDSAGIPASDVPASGHLASDRSASDRSASDRSASDRSASDRSASDRPASDGPVLDGPAVRRPAVGRPAPGDRAPDLSGPDVTTDPEPVSEPPTAPGSEVGERRATSSAGPSSTEGMGLADLLAGALAAYRGI